jgi:hypothetical protein
MDNAPAVPCRPSALKVRNGSKPAPTALRCDFRFAPKTRHASGLSGRPIDRHQGCAMGRKSSGETVTGSNRPFGDPIPLPRGRQLVTLKDAGTYITKLAKAERWRNSKRRWKPRCRLRAVFFYVIRLIIEFEIRLVVFLNRSV